MGISRPGAWSRFEQVHVDLSDVVGTPGIPQGAELADRLASSTGEEWSQLVPGAGLFLAGRAEPSPAPTERGVSAFGPAAGPVVGQLNEAVAGTETPFSDDDVVARRTSACGTHVVGHQRVRGAQIVGARYGVHADELGNVSVTGRPVGAVAARDPGPPPPVPAEEAARAVRVAFEVPPEIAISVERVVFPVAGEGTWAFRAGFTLRDPVAEVRAFVRADDLSVLVSYNVSCAALFGEARVFPVNPGRTPELHAVRLEQLGPPADRLTGAAIDVRPSAGEGLVAPERDWRLEPDHTGFDQATAYYHLWAATRWTAGVLGRRLFEATPFAPLKAVVGRRSADGNAFFVPSSGEIVFGGGSRPTSRSADIVFHEFGHAVADAVCQLNRSPVRQAKGLSEGYGDYVAASAFDDPRFGDWVADAPDGARNCADPTLRFPAGWEGEEHQTGSVWAAVLWGIRSRVGPEVADLLVLESLQFLGPASTFEDGRAALARVDAALFPSPAGPGRHAQVIDEEFAARRPG